MASTTPVVSGRGGGGCRAGGGTWWLLIKETRGAEIATVLALTVTVLGLLVAVGTFAVTRPVADESKRLLSAARGLAGEVRKQEENVLVQLLGTLGDPAKVEFSQPELVHWRTDGGDRQGSLAQIECYYRELQRGRLVVLGKAGSGKTVLAITLIRNLAAAIVATPPSQEGPEGPIVVPVRLSLPAFDPAPSGENLDEVPTERVVEQLEQWLAGHGVRGSVHDGHSAGDPRMDLAGARRARRDGPHWGEAGAGSSGASCAQPPHHRRATPGGPNLPHRTLRAAHRSSTRRCQRHYRDRS